MQSLRLKALITAIAATAGFVVTYAIAQDSGATFKPAETQAASSSTADSTGVKFSEKSIGLKAPPPRITDVISLPFGMNYFRDSKSLLFSIDSKNDWGIGLNLDVNSSRSVELAPSVPALGLQPKRTPGLMLQMKF